MTPSFGLPPGYRSNDAPAYFDDAPSGLVYQPAVYDFAKHLVERSGARHVIDIGCGSGAKLVPLAAVASVIGVDYGRNLRSFGEQVRGQSIEWDLERGVPALDEEVARDAVVIASDVVEHLRDPGPFLSGLARLSRTCRYLLISTPDRDRARGPGDAGPPANRAHAREWNLDEFVRLLRGERFLLGPVGYTVNTSHHGVKSTILALAGRESVPDAGHAPSVLAVVNVFNEADVIGETVEHLVGQGVRVHAVDNWSNDGSFEILTGMAARWPALTVERFPEAPVEQYRWADLLRNVCRVAERIGCEWVIHNDADEKRFAPWPGVALPQALGWVDRLGYSAVDFTVVDFRFLASGAGGGGNHEERLRFFEFGRRPGHFVQVKAWRAQQGVPVDLWTSGGHEAAFSGRRVYPLKFLVKHYPLRSPEQARRKILVDRLPRIAEERRSLGWHTQYDRFATGDVSGWSRSGLCAWSDQMFAAEYLVERLSGIGIERE